MFFEHEVLINGSLKTVQSKLDQVYWLPGLSSRIISVGTLLQDGMKMVGDNNALSFYYKGQKSKGLHFVPRTPGNVIYTLRCKFLPLDANILLSAVNSVDYNLMHQQMDHPSEGVLRKTIDHTTGFPPNILFPNNDSVCRGCADSKMHSKSYPDSQTRATRPFSKIRSNLKQFPIESYHKFKYFMSFFDDFSSRAWTVLVVEQPEWPYLFLLISTFLFIFSFLTPSIDIDIRAYYNIRHIQEL